MAAKRIKIVLAVYLALFLQWPGSSLAAGAEFRANPAKHSPYDRKSALTEVLSGPYQPAARSSAGPIDSLFRTARRFVYSREKNGDDWQFPQETQRKQSGDCEDKALWLYAHLRAAGYGNLQLVVGKYRSLDAGYHVWLTRVDEKGNVFILDPTIQNKIWPSDAFQPGYYRPLFLFG